ncbi:tape measure protein [Mesorhizobium sp. M0189]|uniref:tape measure protein n=1 Tax=Mesorhizobium sp. M0189 TaxID=2956909 RepID=UPI00333CE0A2
MVAASIGNIHVALYVDTNQTARFTSAANIIDRDSKRMRSALAGTDRSITSLHSNMSKNFQFRLASESLRTLSQATTEANRLRAAMLGVAAITGTGITGAFGGAWLLQTADKARLLSNQLKTVTTSSTDLAVVQDKLFDISQRTRSGLEATTTLYARTARATENFGLSQQKLLDITETVQKALAIGGASPAEAQGAAIQLSQGIASNRFSGDEFRSVAENAPVLLRAMAESLTKGSIGDLRKLAFEGQLTAEKVTSAILAGKKRIDAEFAKSTPTLGQSLIQVENSFIRYIGDTDTAYGATKNLASALKGLADNFDDVMYWVTRVGGGIATLWGARSVGSAASGFIGRVSGNSAAIREDIKALKLEAADITARRGEIGREMAALAENTRQQEAKIGGDRASKIHAASEKEYNAQQGVSVVEKQRAEIANRIVLARNDSVARLQREVEISRQAVRDDGLRVAQAQEAALAEERNLRARQAQRVASADETVRARSDAVGAAGGRVAETQAAIAKERELASAKLQGEIASRQESIVTSSMRLQSTQKQIAELRSVQNLDGFDQTFGGQYKRLLGDQQKFIAQTGQARDEITGLQSKLTDLDAGVGVTRGLTAAMNQHATAVKNAQQALESLGKAETSRNAIAAAPIGGKSLDARLKTEAAELARYEKSVGNLQSKMRLLAEASTGAFDTKATQKMVAQLGVLDQKLTLARTNLLSASQAVAAAQGNDASSVGAAMAVRETALRDYHALEAESAVLIARTTENVEKQAVAHKNLNVIRRTGSSIGNGVLNFFGGAVGLSITALLVGATIGLTSYFAASQKAAERTDQLKKEMLDLGITTADAAESIDGATKSLGEMKLDQLKVKLAAINAEMKDISTSQTVFGQIFNRDWKNLGNILQQVQATQQLRGNDVEGNAAKSIEDIVTQAMTGKGVASDLLARLDEIGKLDLSTQMLILIQRTREQIKYMADLGVLAKDYAAAVKDASNGMGKGPRVGSQTMGERFDDVQSQRDENLHRRMYPDELATTTQQAMDAANKSMHDLIGFYEGTDKGRGYNETLDFGKWTGDVNLTSMTLREILQLQQKMLANPANRAAYGDGKGSSALGRYQIVSTTLKDQMAKLGLSMDDFFTPEMQDRIADNLIRQRGRDPEGLRNEWQGLNKAPDHLINRAFDATTLPPLDQGWQQWLDGLKDLDLQTKLANLDEFNQRIVQQAQSMGVGADEIKKYVEAVSSGNLDAIPEKFKAITDGMQSVVDSGVVRQLQELDLSRTVASLSAVEQKTIEMARQFGVAEPVVRAYIAALKSGETVPPVMAAIQDSVQQLTEDERMTKFTDGVAEAVGGLATDLIHGEDGLQGFIERLADLALQILVIEPLVQALKDALNGIGGGGGFFGSLMSGLGSILGFDEGGYTGGKQGQVRGFVHGEEFVVRASEVAKPGVRQFLEGLNNNKLGMLQRGFAKGGYVGPQAPLLSLPPAFADQQKDMHITVGWSRTADGNLKPFIETVSGQTAGQVVSAGLSQYDKNLPARFGDIMERHA